MKLYMQHVHGIRSQKPLRPTRRPLFLGILQTGMDLHRKKFFSSKIYILLESLLKTEQILLKELGLKMD